MKRLMKVFSDGSAMWKGWRTTGLIRGSINKRCIDTVKECLKKRGLDVRQARTTVHDRSVWWGFVRGNPWGVARGMNP